ncbi:MAG: phosphohistidine phosphatase SixA [Desulfomonilia bacterium]
MMVYLVQHGRSLPKEVDPDRGLTDQGRAEVERVASKASKIGLSVALIIHSGKTRALKTAEILAARLTPGSQPVMEPGLNPHDDVAAFAATLPARDNLMVVGHLPFMERLVSYLITGTPEKPVIRFRNAGIVCLEYDRMENTWAIEWVLTPEIA